jgi:hypothetical protein
MNYLILIIVAIAGIALGAYFVRGRNSGLIAEQGKKKTSKKSWIFCERIGKYKTMMLKSWLEYLMLQLSDI